MTDTGLARRDVTIVVQQQHGAPAPGRPPAAAVTSAEWLRRLEAAFRDPSQFRTARDALRDASNETMLHDFLDLVFRTARAQCTNDATADEIYTQTTAPAWQFGVQACLQAERDNIVGRRQLRRTLNASAGRGLLAVRAADQRRADGFGPPTGPTTVDGELARAARWMSANSPQPAADAARYTALLRDALLRLGLAVDRGGFAERRDVSAAEFGSPLLVRRLHRELSGTFSSRMHHLAARTKYPSTVGGGLLLEELYTSTTVPPMSVTRLEDYWSNWASYFSSMIVAAQAFRDGNKRIAHAMYALVLVGGTGSFFAPTTEFENRLAPME